MDVQLGRWNGLIDGPQLGWGLPQLRPRALSSAGWTGIAAAWIGALMIVGRSLDDDDMLCACTATIL